MEVLASRVIIRPIDFDRSVAFYRDTLELEVVRTFQADGQVLGVVFGMAGGFLELSGAGAQPAGATTLWLQVADLRVAFEQVMAKGAPMVEPYGRRPWGLLEAWVADPDGNSIALVEAPPDHPLHL